MTYFKYFLAYTTIALNTYNVDSCALDLYKCGQQNVIETYDTVKKFKMYIGHLEEFKMSINSTLIYLEIDDIDENILLKKTFNSTKINNSLYSSEANTNILSSYTMYIITLIIPEDLPIFLKINCN
jgi:hypothetical protein